MKKLLAVIICLGLLVACIISVYAYNTNNAGYAMSDEELADFINTAQPVPVPSYSTQGELYDEDYGSYCYDVATGEEYFIPGDSIQSYSQGENVGNSPEYNPNPTEIIP